MGVVELAELLPPPVRRRGVGVGVGVVVVRGVRRRGSRLLPLHAR